MNDFHFVADENHQQIDIPFYEEARADLAPYYDNRTYSISQAQNEVITELAKLGAGGIQFVPGHFGDNPKRYGYMIRYWYGGAEGLIRVAGLPIQKSETKRKVEKVRLQALLNVRDWLKALVTQQVFSPGSEPLIQFLLVDGRRTVTEAIIESGRLPQLNPPNDDVPLIEGEIVN